MLYLAIRPFHLFIYCPKRLVLADFYILSTCWESRWETNKMVFSIPGQPSRACHPLSGMQGTAVGPSAELLALLLRPPPPPTSTQISRRPYRYHVPVMCNFHADLRPWKTNSWLSDSQTSTSHAFWSSFSSQTLQQRPLQGAGVQIIWLLKSPG